MTQKRQAKTAARGYGAKHKALRRRWEREVREGNVSCSRCAEFIYPGEPWDLGHVDGDKTRYAGPEHRRCNRATASHKARRKRRTAYAFVEHRAVSRSW
jgi:hypothetical protein